MIAILLGTRVFRVAVAAIERDVARHRQMHVEPRLVIAATLRLTLDEVEKAPAMAAALVRRRDGDGLDEEMIRAELQHGHADDRGVLAQHPDGALRHARQIVLEHWPWRAPD